MDEEGSILISEVVEVDLVVFEGEVEEVGSQEEEVEADPSSANNPTILITSPRPPDLPPLSLPTRPASLLLPLLERPRTAVRGLSAWLPSRPSCRLSGRGER